jgi:hypothetical protein
MPDKTPRGLVEVACLSARSLPPGSWCARIVSDSRLVPFPGFPFRASIAVYPHYPVPTTGARRGFPGSPTYLFLHATACGLRRTSTPSPNRMLRVAFGYVKTLGIRDKLISKLYQHFRERDLPYGLQNSLPTLSPSCSPTPLGATPPWTQGSIRVGG